MKALVIGGGGFLGRAIVECLLARGHEVTSFGRSPQPEIAKLGAATIEGDIADKAAIRAAAEKHDTLFHCAALAGVWGPRAEFERVNVLGTRNVIAAAQAARMPRLIFTSTPSVCFDGRDHRRASNELPYAKSFLCAYPRTKCAAERDVLFASGRFGLETCALRPHLIFGPRDPHLLPRLIERARAKKLRIVGDGENEVSVTFVDNAALAHVLAAESLSPKAPHAGKAYFLGEREPVKLWNWIANLLARLELPPIERRVSAKAAYAAGAACELAWKLAGRADEPPMTRFVALQLSTSHSYDLAPAERDFGFHPAVSMDEALERTIVQFAERGRAARA